MTTRGSRQNLTAVFRVADWVTTREGGNGIIRRLARDGSWADVLWRDPMMRPYEWTKRMPTSSLVLVVTLQLPGGWTVTDVIREEEAKCAAAGSHEEAAARTSSLVGAPPKEGT